MIPASACGSSLYNFVSRAMISVLFASGSQ
jgi:hypothetical protein